MKKFKMVTTMIVGATLMVSSVAMVTAADDNKLVMPITSNSVEADTITSKVIVKSINNDNNLKSIVVTLVDDNSMDIVLKISEDTKIDLDSIKEGDIVTATYSKAMTRSIPPQTNAVSVIKDNDDNNDNAASEPLPLSVMNLNAVISEITTGEYKSILVDDSNNKNSQISLNIDDNTIIIKATGEPLNFSDLKEGDKINVVHSPAMTFSLPPQTYSYAIIVNNEQVTPPHYIEVSNIETKDGTTIIESKDKNYILRLNEDTELLPFKTKNIVSADDIKEGSRIFAWFDIVALSMPAQATANKVMILPQLDELNSSSDEQIEAVTVFDKIIIDGNEFDLNDKKVEIYKKETDDLIEEINMLPLRPIAEELGFEINWNQNTNSIDLDKGMVKISLSVNQTDYTIENPLARLDNKETKSLSISPININGNTYIPLELIDTLTANEASITIVDGTININLV